MFALSCCFVFLFAFFSVTPVFASEISNQFTISLYVKPTTSITSKAIVGKAEEVRIFTDGSGLPGCQFKSTTWQTAASGTTALSLNSWSHLACTYDKQNLRIYINGIQVGSTALTTQADDTANNFLVGEDDSASTTYTNLIGTVDQFQVYNYARTAKQIAEDINAGDPLTSRTSNTSPIGYWPMDEGVDNTCTGGVNDVCNYGTGGSALNGAESGMSVPATATSGWTDQGKFGKALIFDGSSDYVDVGNSSAFNFGSGNYAFSAWVKPTLGAANGFVIGKDDDVAGRQFLWNIKSDGTTLMSLFYSGSSLTAYQSAAGVIQANVWQHVVWQRNGNKFELYVNGVNKNAVYDTADSNADFPQTMSTTTANVNIGRRSYSGSNLYFPGQIDEVKIYNYALSKDEILVDFNKGSSQILGALSDNSAYQPNAANQEYCVPGDTTSCAAPKARWDCNEGKDNTCSATADVCDTSGNANNGTWSGTGSHWISGKVGKAGKFNGSDDYVLSANNTGITGSSSRTISGWFKSASLSTPQTLVYYGPCTIGKRFLVGVNSSKLYFVSYGTPGVNDFSANTTLNSNTWYHFTATYDGTTAKLYLNGILDGSLITTINTTDSTVSIGRNETCGGWNYFNGQIDQVRIFNYARSAAQIAWDYNKGKPVGWWTLDECQGTIAHDMSGNRNDGTLTATSTIGTCNTSSTFWGGTGGTGAGKLNSAPTFNGTGDYIDSIGSVSSYSFIQNTGIFSVSAWFKLTDYTADAVKVILGNTPAATAEKGFWLGYENRTGVGTKQLRVDLDKGVLNTPIITSYSPTNSITDNNWHHVVATGDGTNITFYIDGISKAGTSSMVTKSSGDSSRTLNIGRANYSSSLGLFNGQIDDAKIFNYALTSTQVKMLYNNGAVNFGPTSGTP